MGLPLQSPPTPPNIDDVFEGPEKKLEIYLSPGVSADGLRQFSTDEWADLLAEASCTILSHKSNAYLDAYLLSESSLFVFPYRVILKTCGTTTLLLVLPKLIRMASQLGTALELVQYGHLRYKFPEQQIFPHGSFAEEQAYLATHCREVRNCVLGPSNGACWYMLSANDFAVRQAFRSSAMTLPVPESPRDGDDVLEIAMEGLSPAVCQLFNRSSSLYACSLPDKDRMGTSERDLARCMTASSGLAKALPGVAIDDWAFDPCGYSMNGTREGFYYTVHVTPELDFSYASFESNDPMYRDPRLLQQIVALFEPASAVVTLTTRRIDCELPAYELPSYKRSSFEVRQLGQFTSVCYSHFMSISSRVGERSTPSSKASDCGKEIIYQCDHPLVAAA